MNLNGWCLRFGAEGLRFALREVPADDSCGDDDEGDEQGDAGTEEAAVALFFALLEEPFITI